jgi:hypothetical protein
LVSASGKQTATSQWSIRAAYLWLEYNHFSTAVWVDRVDATSQ